jgi:cytochrome c oxidase subunit 3
MENEGLSIDDLGSIDYGIKYPAPGCLHCNDISMIENVKVDRIREKEKEVKNPIFICNKSLKPENNGAVGLPTHPYHIVDQSPWPITLAGVLLSLTISAVLSFQGYPMGDYLLLISFILLNWGMSLWFKDIITEASFLGSHTDKVQKGISLGVVLFIISEVFFFLSIFWAYFHSSLAPAIEIGSEWPPKGIEPINASEVPTANTTLLLSSGSAVTVTHHSLVDRLIDWANNGSVATVIMALFFTLLQGMEYIGLSYTITDSVFGSTFYMGTGFHGLHVIIGTLFLLVGSFRIFSYQVTNTHHVGVESGILYWHFVDVVWLFLFGAVYFWGGQGA